MKAALTITEGVRKVKVTIVVDAMILISTGILMWHGTIEDDSVWSEAIQWVAVLTAGVMGIGNPLSAWANAYKESKKNNSNSNGNGNGNDAGGGK